MKIKELLSDKNRWTQKLFAIDKEGKYVKPTDESAYKLCLIGAKDKCYGITTEGDKVYKKLKNSIQKLFPEFNHLMSVTAFNDSHCYEDIMKVVNDADV